MNKRRKSITRRVRSTRSGKYAGDEIKQHVAGLKELKNHKVSYKKGKASIVNKSDRSLDDNLDNWRMTSVGDESKRLVKWGFYNKPTIDQRQAKQRRLERNLNGFIQVICILAVWFFLCWVLAQSVKRR